MTLADHLWGVCFILATVYVAMSAYDWLERWGNNSPAKESDP